MNFVVPPGGLTGFAQMTAASRRALFPGNGSAPSRRRRRKKKSAKRAKVARARRSKGRKLKFGSPAWRKKYLKK